ncbi:MAG TPA: beta-L-arabinofuranosidase domain-containing protein, partial [Puia sp.]|nr:beta-L-arabinofuranosidase domain-containing protein [Puia sp.]
MSNPIVAQSSLNQLSYLRNRYPLHPKAYLSLPFGTIKPKAWLFDQLVSMKNGMCGNLDKLYPAVLGKRNGWLGGDGDVWERGPYWLDGLAPLAFILDDAGLKAKLQPWIEWSIANQQPDGYFGPMPPKKEPAPEPGLQRDRARDWWPKMVMLKVLQQYYLGTGDQRVIQLMLRYARYQLKTLPDTPLGHYSWWGAQ